MDLANPYVKMKTTESQGNVFPGKGHNLSSDSPFSKKNRSGANS